MNNYKKIILLLISLLISSIVFSQNSIEKYNKITLEDLWENFTFSPQSVYGLRSMNDGVHYTVIEKHKEISKYSFKTGKKVATIFGIDELKNDSIIKYISNYEFNHDETKILFYINRTRIYRRSFTANYYVWNLKTKKLLPVSTNGKQRIATFSPDGINIAFVRDNNLFIKNIVDGKEKQITNDGEFNKIINGAPDWVYEEEFEYNKAFAWSPKGDYLAFCKFDESNVRVFNMTLFQGSHPTKKKNALYPENYAFKYPKAGEDNSIVSVHVYNLNSEKTSKMDVGDEKDQYIPRIRWTQQNNLLGIIRLNRLQNNVEILLDNADNGSSKVIYTEKNKYYIDEGNFDNITFLKDGKHFILTSEKSAYSHIYLYNMDGSLVNQVTKGNWDVTDYIGFDSKKKLVYYISAETSPLRRNVYSIKIDGTKKKKLSTQEGTNDALFSEGFKYYINYFSNATTPNYVTLNNSKGKLIRVLEDNKKLIDTLKTYQYNTKEFFSFKTSENVELNGWILKPYNFDKNKKYPVLMTQYSGPNSQSATDEWSFGWNQYLAQNGYIVVCVDGRGTGARGEGFRKMTYLQLGKYETIDQIEAAKYLGSLPYVDESRIGIWGWSYGGFMSLLCMTKGADYFKAGIAVAPVTNWRYYDNVYTERFMRTPQENPKGYDDNSPINFVDKLNGKLLICHGTADDNVHVQNSIEIIEKLVQANKQFEMQYYPNRNHSIYGGKTRLHLYTRMTNFVLDNL
ncbi:MAG: S9 family peptidase [Bacteroidetes bacterium]|nr:S9 family peptidase [Bacteroidota bacterium]